MTAHLSTYTPRGEIAQELIHLRVGSRLEDKYQGTVTDRKSASEDFLVGFKLHERVKRGKDAAFQNLNGLLRRSESRPFRTSH